MLRRTLMVGLTTLALGLAACGDDNDDEGAGDAGAPAATSSAPQTEPAPDAVTGGAGAVALTADPDGGLAYEQDQLQASAGAVTIAFENPSPVAHDVVIESADGEDVAASDEISSGETTLEADLEPGRYAFYCSVSNHREVGMEGVLTVR